MVRVFTNKMSVAKLRKFESHGCLIFRHIGDIIYSVTVGYDLQFFDKCRILALHGYAKPRPHRTSAPRPVFLAGFSGLRICPTPRPVDPFNLTKLGRFLSTARHRANYGDN